MNARLIAMMLVLGLGVATMTGCAGTAKSFAGLFYGDDIEELKKQKRSLEPRYKARVKVFEEKIGEKKTEISAALESKDLITGAQVLVELYALTHPCGEEDCGTYPCEQRERSDEGMPALNRSEVFIEREGVDNESAFIMSSTDILLELSTEAFGNGEFEKVNSALDVMNTNLPYVSMNQEGYAALTFKTKSALITKLAEEAKAFEPDNPAAAATRYERAASLATELGEDRQAEDFKAKALSLRGS